MKIAIAEQFYSIQGEGRYSGAPAVFLRLSGCNLLCGGRGTDKDGQLHNGATWRCDTIEVWRKGRGTEVANLIDDWKMDGTFNRFDDGAHLVITGGEPLLQQLALKELLQQLERFYTRPFIEIETNGTVETQLSSPLILRYNCSPKLSNSGMSANLRRVQLSRIGMTDFKFVVDRAEDIAEVMEVVKEHRIPREQVYLMPATDNRDTLLQRSEVVAELCKQFRFNFSSRHQVMIWDRTTGV